jgi:hypothetical protein
MNSNNKNLKGKEQKITGTISGASKWSSIFAGNTNMVSPRIFAVDYVIELAGTVRTVRCVSQQVLLCCLARSLVFNLQAFLQQ